MAHVPAGTTEGRRCIAWTGADVGALAFGVRALERRSWVGPRSRKSLGPSFAVSPFQRFSVSPFPPPPVPSLTSASLWAIWGDVHGTARQHIWPQNSARAAGGVSFGCTGQEPWRSASLRASERGIPAACPRTGGQGCPRPPSRPRSSARRLRPSGFGFPPSLVFGPGSFLLVSTMPVHG